MRGPGDAPAVREPYRMPVEGGPARPHSVSAGTRSQMQKRSIGEIFVSADLITEEQLTQALDKQRQLGTGETIGDVLVSMGLISDRDRARCLGVHWGVQYVDLSDDYPVDEEAVRCVSQEIARRYKAIPITRNNGHITLAMKNPLDIFAIDEVRLITGLDVEPMIATEEDILSAIGRFYGSTQSAEAVSELIDNIETTEIALTEGDNVKEDEVSIEELRELSEEAPIVRLCNLILNRGIQDRCSDIHLEPGKTALRVRYRIDGILHDGLLVPKKAQASLISRIKIMSEMDIAEKRAPQDGRISAMVDGRQYDFRVSTLPSVYGEKVVLRVLDKSSIMIGLNKLGFLPQTHEMFESIISRSYGIILVTGPTGSGKSTTLYSVLSKLNSGEKNILTIEDPVEYELAGITQTQVNVRAGMTFASGLRTMLRQDPNIIMVGEIRDFETAEIAIKASMTGHLVLSTLHTNDAPSTIGRITNMGIEPFMVTTSVLLVQAQRLVRKICKDCKYEIKPRAEQISQFGITPELMRRLELPHINEKNMLFYKGKGCETCNNSGNKGRVGVYEVMIMSERLRDIILNGGSTDDIRKQAIDEGMLSLRESALRKALLGTTSIEEVVRVTMGEH